MKKHVLLNKIIVLFILFLFFSQFISAQDTIFARRIIAGLSSPEMHGRGYVKQGLKKAARYLEREYKQIGIKPIGHSFRQTFYIKVNTFPGNVIMKTKYQAFIPGTDFLVSANSKGCKGWFPLLRLDTLNLTFKDTSYLKSYNFSRKMVLTKPENLLVLQDYIINANGIITPQEKLMWSFQGIDKVVQATNIELSHNVKIKGDSVYLNIKNKFKRHYKVSNIVGYIPGTVKRDSFLIITAHYDHLGRMGDGVYFPGANDNASGVALMLDLARQISTNPLEYSVIFIAFCGEEIGLKGSEWFVTHAPIDLRCVRMVINLDMVGGAKDGITVVNGVKNSAFVNQLKRININMNLNLKINIRPQACISDHCFFDQLNIPSIFIYSTDKSYSEYHNPNDLPGKLPLSNYNELTTLLFHCLSNY